MKKAFFSVTPFELDKTMSEAGYGTSALRRLMSKLYRGILSDFPKSDEEMNSEFLTYLDTHYHLKLPVIKEVHKSNDGTIKFLIEFKDGKNAEMVAMPFNKKYTLCLSSQIGCAMKCSFCFTGTQGLSRHLSSDEIVGEYLLGRSYLQKEIGNMVNPNIVFMGQGEPLHNFDELKKAIEVLTTAPGVSLGAKQIAISTVGHLPGLKRFKELPPVHLAISLHSAFEEERSRLIPSNKSYGLEELMKTLKSLDIHDRKRINFEYLLLKDVNDSELHADKLNEYVAQIPCYVNIIPFNPYPGSLYERPSDKGIEMFKSYLVEHDIKAMVRKTRGDDILAACGQLANKV
jgi:23S rRNA (adenine2503-C2)-methyltransferase